MFKPSLLFRCVRLKSILFLTSRLGRTIVLPKRICILAPHPDDETMGCGLLIAEACARGVPCTVVVVSNGAGSHCGCCDMSEEQLVMARQASCRQATGVLGLPPEDVAFLGFPDNELHLHEDDIMAQVKAILGEQPVTLFVPHAGEGWSDHLVVHRLGKQLAATMTEIRLYSYCVWFYYSMPFRKFPRVRWSAAKLLQDDGARKKKHAALALYQSDVAPCGKPYAGVLPELLWRAVNGKQEVYFEE